QPRLLAAGRSVAGLAANAVAAQGDDVFRDILVGELWDGVAGETARVFSRIFDAKVRGHALAAILSEYCVGPGVLVVQEDVRVFVALGDFFLERLGATVAAACRTGRCPSKPHVAVLRRLGGRRLIGFRRAAYGPGEAPNAHGDESETADPQTSVHGTSWLG